MALESFYSPAYGEFQPKHVDVSIGNNELVAAVASKRIEVYCFMLSGDATVKYQLSSGNNEIFTFYGIEYFGVPLEAGSKQIPLFLTNVGEVLTLSVSGIVNANVYLLYKVTP